MDGPAGLGYGDRMKQPAFCRTFATRAAAEERAHLKNRANRMPNWLWVVIDGPADDFAVVDLRTAIEMGAPYSWSA